MPAKTNNIVTTGHMTYSIKITIGHPPSYVYCIISIGDSMGKAQHSLPRPPVQKVFKIAGEKLWHKGTLDILTNKNTVTVDYF